MDPGKDSAFLIPLVSMAKAPPEPRASQPGAAPDAVNRAGELSRSARVPPAWKGGTPATVVIGKIAFEFPIHCHDAKTREHKEHLPAGMRDKHRHTEERREGKLSCAVLEQR
jgi:hypothetical protein